MAWRMESVVERRTAAADRLRDRRERTPRSSAITDLMQRYSYSRRPRATRAENGELTASAAPSRAQGGFECEFVDSVPDSLQCPVCLLPFRDPHMLDCCGAKYCAVCIEAVKTDHKPCPICRHPTFNAMLDKNEQRKVLGLKVYCSRKSKGCVWKGELRCLEKHVSDSCGWAEVSCRFCDHKVFRCLRAAHEQEECSQQQAKLKVDSLKRTVELCLVSEMSSLKQELKRDMDKMNTALRREMKTEAIIADFKRTEMRREVSAEIKDLCREKEKAHNTELKELMDKAFIAGAKALQQKIDKAHSNKIKELRREIEETHNADIRGLKLKMDRLGSSASDTSDIKQLRREMNAKFTIYDTNLNESRKKHCIQMFTLVALFAVILAIAALYF